jgi:hypothetical protein
MEAVKNLQLCIRKGNKISKLSGERTLFAVHAGAFTFLVSRRTDSRKYGIVGCAPTFLTWISMFYS